MGTTKREPEEPHKSFIKFLNSVPGLTYIYYESYTWAWGPNLASAAVLSAKYKLGLPYEGPFPEPDFRIDRRSALIRCREIVDAVEKRVGDLKGSVENFVLLWQAFGEEEPHLDHSVNFLDDRDSAKELVESVVRRVAGYDWLDCGLHLEDHN